MSYTWKTEGFILKRTSFKEVDRLYTLYTRENGKFVVQASGIRKIQSKLAGHSEPFMLSSFFIARGKSIDRLAGSQVRKSYRTLRENLNHVHIAQYIAETIDHMVKEHHADQKIYGMLEDAFDFLNEKKHTEATLWLFTLVWRWKLLETLGYTPELNFCAAGKHTLSGTCFFQPHHGGVVCNEHRSKEAQRISEKTHKLLKKALHGRREEIEIMTALPSDWKDFAQTIRLFFDYIASAYLKSSLFLPQEKARIRINQKT